MNELNQQGRDLLDFYKAQIVDLNQQLGQRIERITELEAALMGVVAVWDGYGDVRTFETDARQAIENSA